MYQVDIEMDSARMFITLSGRFTEAEAIALLGDCEARVAEIEAVKHVFADFSELEVFDRAARAHYRKVMDLCNGAGVEKVARVFADPMDTFGMSIMSIFHYDDPVQPRHYDSTERAMKYLK